MSLDGPCLQLDVGNSSAKWRLVVEGEVRDRGRFVAGDADSRAALLSIRPAPASIWVASVAAPEADKALAELLGAAWDVPPVFARTPGRTGDLINSYADPGRMGVDRWLAMLGARRRCQERLCVVDAGSALTIDLVAADGAHEGGYIIPGADLMERALLLDTDRVRFDERTGYALSPGRSTASAVRHGIALAMAGAVRLALEGEQPPRLLYCGGGGELLMERVGLGGSWAPDLVFEGLEVMAALGDL